MHIQTQGTDKLQGTVEIPASKSETLRALIFGLVTEGTTRITHPLDATDISDGIAACRTLGATIHTASDALTVISAGAPLNTDATHLYTGESGIVTRCTLPLLGLRANTDLPVTIQCGAQMSTRPMDGLFKALRDLGMEIDYPYVRGPLVGGVTTLNASISQFLSALLIALPLAQNDSNIRVGHIPAQSYVEMTLSGLKLRGIQIERETDNQGQTYLIPGQQTYQPKDVTISGDFSNASYFIAAGVMFPGTITLTGLSMDSLQGDKACITLLQSMGADIVVEHNAIHIRGGKTLDGIEIDAAAIPDLVPTLAVIGTYARGKTILHNVSPARLKETDRIHSMTEGLRALGATVTESPNGMIIQQSSLKGAHVNGYGDHRTVMALTLAGMRASGTTTISDAQAIQKTFPAYIEKMQMLGASVEVQS